MGILGIYASQISGHLANYAYESIATVTVGAGGSSSISFTSIPSTYKHLQIRVFAKGTSAGDQDANLRVGNGSIDSGSNYSWHTMYANAVPNVAAASGSTQTKAIIGFNYAVATGNSMGSVSIIDILDYADTNKYKTLKTLSGVDKNGSGIIGMYSGSWRSTSGINQIEIYPDAGNWGQYSSFALYGIKG